MIFSKFIFEAKKLTIMRAENDVWYLDPEWKDIICRNIESDLEKIEDNYLIDWWDIENDLRLEVDKRNAKDDKKKVVIDWLYDLITTKVEPAMLAEETDYIKNVVEFMKVNHENQRENQRENQKDNIVPFPTK